MRKGEGFRVRIGKGTGNFRYQPHPPIPSPLKKIGVSIEMYVKGEGESGA